MTDRSIALYGGSFDPPHLGHVLSVAWALSAAPVDEVWVIPTWQHVFGKEAGATFEVRFSMCREAFAPFQGVQILDVERRLGGVSHTLRTIETLAAENPGAEFRLLIGADILGTTGRWHRWDDGAAAAPPLVVGREGYPVSADCPISIPDINSTEIRSRIANGEGLDGIVPRAVIALIEDQGVYRDRE